MFHTLPGCLINIPLNNHNGCENGLNVSWLLQNSEVTYIEECHAYKRVNTMYKNSMALSPQANYTDWATATCRQNLVPTFVDREVSRGQSGGSPAVVNLSFLDRNTMYMAYKFEKYPASVTLRILLTISNHIFMLPFNTDINNDKVTNERDTDFPSKGITMHPQNSKCIPLCTLQMWSANI
jgi:hypothetical protein